MDFVLSDGDAIVPIEVKYSYLKNPEITRSLRNFISDYSPAEALIVNLSLETEIEIGNTKVKFIPYYKI